MAIEGFNSGLLDLDKVLASGRGQTRFVREIGEAQLEVALFETHGTLTVHHESNPSVSTNVVLMQEIDLVALPWAFGGKRWFMVCPASGVLMVKARRPPGAKSYASRQAWGLTYRSTRMSRIDRGHARIARAYARLGGTYHSVNDEVPARPKGMHITTYNRRLESIVRERNRHLEIGQCRLMDWLESRLTARIEETVHPTLDQ